VLNDRIGEAANVVHKGKPLTFFQGFKMALNADKSAFAENTNYYLINSVCVAAFEEKEL